MKQSEESRKLQEYAATVDKTYPAFVRSMGVNPQRSGIDKQLWAYVEENQPDYDEMMAEYVILCGCYDGEITAKELVVELQEVIANQN